MLDLLDPAVARRIRIKVIGVGGAGGRAVNNMIRSGLTGVDYGVVDADSNALGHSRAAECVQLKIGSAAAANPDSDVGRAAAFEAREAIAGLLDGADMVFVVAGLGGDTGTGAAPVVCEVARDLGALTVGVLSLPRPFEGRRRWQRAQDGFAAVMAQADAIIRTPPTLDLAVGFDMVEDRRPAERAEAVQAGRFGAADDAMRKAVAAITELVDGRGGNGDEFAFVRAELTGPGPAGIGIGAASGSDRTMDAAERALESLRHGANILGAKRLLLSFRASSSLDQPEIDDAIALLWEECGVETRLTSRFIVDHALGDEVRMVVVASGLCFGPRMFSTLRKAPARTPPGPGL